MRILKLLSRLLVVLIMGAMFIAPALASAQASLGPTKLGPTSLGRERAAEPAASHHHAGHEAHDHAVMVPAADAGSKMPHERSKAPPDAPCTTGCCATGMACCTAVLAEPVVVRLQGPRRMARVITIAFLSGIEPDVPLKPPRSER